VCIEKQSTNIQKKTILQLRNDLNQLPKNSVPVLDKQKELATVSEDNFWINLTENRMEFLTKEIAQSLKLFGCWF